jgi:hypothetical protein
VCTHSEHQARTIKILHSLRAWNCWQRKTLKISWGPGAAKALVGCRGNALLGGHRGVKPPQKKMDFRDLKKQFWPFQEAFYIMKEKC